MSLRYFQQNDSASAYTLFTPGYNLSGQHGIRKVIGASTSRLITLLSADFLKLVLIGNLIGLPIAWYYMDRWMQNFVVQADFKWWIFAGTTAVAMIIAFVAVLFHSLKVSKANPVKALRTQ